MAKKFLMVMAVLLILPMAAGAVGFTGSRTSANSNEILATDGWAGGGFILSWDIQSVNNGGASCWKYLYTIDTTGGTGGDTSHYIFQVTDDPDVTADNFRDFQVSIDDGPFQSWSDWGIGDFTSANGNPNLPGTLHGLKVDELSGQKIEIMFESTQDPVWGDFYSKDGGGTGADAVTAYNEKLGVPAPDPDSGADFSGYVLTPDTDGGTFEVPEASSLALFGVGLIGVALLGRFRRRR